MTNSAGESNDISKIYNLETSVWQSQFIWCLNSGIQFESRSSNVSCLVTIEHSESSDFIRFIKLNKLHGVPKRASHVYMRITQEILILKIQLGYFSKAKKYNHNFDLEHKKVLDSEKNWKTRTIKEAVYSEENKHHINGISFKLPNIWKLIQRERKAKKTTAKITTSSNLVHKGPPTCIVSRRSATKVNQSETTLKYFDNLPTHKYHTLTHHTAYVSSFVSCQI